jgi:membrane protease YdiL (CAAX protease family)
MNRALASTLLPLILLVAGAAVEWMRAPVALVLVLGLLTSVLAPRRTADARTSQLALVYAGCLLVAVNMTWAGVPLPPCIDATSCTDRLAPFALLRIVGALLVLAAAVLIVRIVRAHPADLGLRLPSRPWLVISLAALPLIGVAAVLLGPVLAKPFFGPISSMSGDPGSLIPALGFALANASMEEVAYRGALLRWLVPVSGVASALAFQAIVFGLAHGVGTDFIGSPLPVVAATAAAGLVFGAVALRTRSLLLPIAIHVALDIPVFYGKVCLGI